MSIEKKINTILNENRSSTATKLINAVSAYSKAAIELSRIWEDAQDEIEDDEWALEIDPPFDKSFDEYAAAVRKWADKSIQMLRKIK